MIARVAAMAYVAAVASLTTLAFSHPAEEHWTAEIAAAMLGLPCVVVALPVIYLLGAAAWHVSDASGDGPMWPVTATFATLMTAVAIGNVLLVTAVASARARTRSAA